MLLDAIDVFLAVIYNYLYWPNARVTLRQCTRGYETRTYIHHRPILNKLSSSGQWVVTKVVYVYMLMPKCLSFESTHFTYMPVWVLMFCWVHICKTVLTYYIQPWHSRFAIYDKVWWFYRQTIHVIHNTCLGIETHNTLGSLCMDKQSTVIMMLYHQYITAITPQYATISRIHTHT